MGYALEQLGAQECRRIAEGLMQVTKVYGTKLNGCCPVHGESNPSAFYNFETDVFACRSCSFTGDLVRLWCEVNGLDDAGEGFKRFQEEFVDNALSRAPQKKRNQEQKPRPVSTAPEVFIPESDLDSLPPLSDDKMTEMRRLRGWSADVMTRMDLRLFVDFKGNERIAMPIRDEQGRLCNIRLYLPGAKEFKVISWYDQTCKACGGKWKVIKKKKTCQQCGGHPNDYGRTRLYPSPDQWAKEGLLWLVEGEPDLLCGLSHGLNAVTQTAGAGTWPDAFSKAFAGRDLVIAYDADGAGYKGALKAGPSLAAHAKSVRVVIWPKEMARG